MAEIKQLKRREAAEDLKNEVAYKISVALGLIPIMENEITERRRDPSISLLYSMEALLEDIQQLCE